MSETRKTATVAGIALTLTVLAWATAHRTTTPNSFQDRGTSFFPGFTDPTMARSLEVVDFDEETATAHPFRVEVKNGLWTIPSYYDYPADGDQRLSMIAGAIIALKKDNVATENVSEHEGTGTLDPLDETLATFHGRGTRVTIKGDNDRMLADVIIGKPLEGRPQFRYVRLADQTRVYVAEVGDLSISTKFADWIDRDLLHIEWNDLDQAIVRDYSLDKATRGVNLRDTLFIQKLGEDDKGQVQWTMRDTQPGEKVDTFRANLLNTTLDQLSILGVRPKPPGVAVGLAQTSGSLKVSQDDLADLANKGFHFTAKGQLLSDEGEVLVHTKTGLFFRLWFGAVAYGDPEESSAAAEANASPAAAAGKKPAASPIAKPAATPAAKTPAPAGTKAAAAVNRYLVISASFDPTDIPAGQARDAAQKRAAALQARFAPWYYVISGQSFERMRLSRHVLLKTEAKKAA